MKKCRHDVLNSGESIAFYMRYELLPRKCCAI